MPIDLILQTVNWVCHDQMWSHLTNSPLEHESTGFIRILLGLKTKGILGPYCEDHCVAWRVEFLSSG